MECTSIEHQVQLMSQIKLTRSAHGEHMMCTRVYTLVQTSLYVGMYFLTFVVTQFNSFIGYLAAL